MRKIISAVIVALASGAVLGLITAWPHDRHGAAVSIPLVPRIAHLRLIDADIRLGKLLQFHVWEHGVYQYCKDYPAECVASPASVADDSYREQAKSINAYVDAAMTWPRGEEEMYGYAFVHEKVWQLHKDGYGLGVCVEHAISKRHMLVQAGVPPGALSLAFLNAEGDVAHSDHMVLLIRFRDAIYVLDNLDSNVWPISAAGYVRYVWFLRQQFGLPNNWLPVDAREDIARG